MEGNGVRPKSLSLRRGDAGVESFPNPRHNPDKSDKQEKEEGETEI